VSTGLADQVVAVTGASSGIGEATARACARVGARVSLAARRAERIEELARRIRGEGGTALAIPTDVSDEDEASTFITRTYSELGRVDVLVNNAGVMLLGPIEDAPTEEWRRMVDANIYGVLYCTHAALPLMRRQRSGHIVNVSSVAGRVARLGSGVYNLTKWGVGAFSESLRQELAPHGIRVTVVEPGAVSTELTSHNRPGIREQISRNFEGVTPLAPEDIAETILFALERPQNVSVNELLVRPVNQQR
jgi:NADP-dependent 3-hydroxy acid dehydrogenase YdfG